MTAAPGTLERLLEEARAELGTSEDPPGSNRQEFSAALGRPPEPWCADFAVVIADRAGIELPGRSAYTPTLANSFREVGRFTSSPALGAFVFYRWPNLGRIAHVGIVERVLADGIVAIEGNTDVAGGRTGGRVMRQLRRANVAGYGLNVFADAPKPAPTPPVVRPTAPPFPLPRGSYFGPRSGPKASVSGYHGHREDLRRWQGQMVARGWRRLIVDGLYGDNTRDTALAFQREKRLGVDGLIGPATWAAAWSAKVT